MYILAKTTSKGIFKSYGYEIRHKKRIHDKISPYHTKTFCTLKKLAGRIYFAV